MQVEDRTRHGWTHHKWSLINETQRGFPGNLYPRGLAGSVSLWQCLLVEGNQVISSEREIGKAILTAFLSKNTF